jgi:hypothetical protein
MPQPVPGWETGSTILTVAHGCFGYRSVDRCLVAQLAEELSCNRHGLAPGVTWSLTTGAGRRFQGEATAARRPPQPAALAKPGSGRSPDEWRRLSHSVGTVRPV